MRVIYLHQVQAWSPVLTIVEKLLRLETRCSNLKTSHLAVTQINIKGAFITAQAFLPTRRKSSVVVATATAGVTLPASKVANVSSYIASKLGLIKFIEVMAAEHPDVRFTTTHPGTVGTNM